MARIPEQDIERLKSEVCVERLIESSGVALRKSGKDWLGQCPFHDDGEPSLVVTPSKNLWHCFGCQTGGGPIDWVMQHRGVSFRHAVELLKEGVSSLAADPVKRTSVRALQVGLRQSHARSSIAGEEPQAGRGDPRPAHEAGAVSRHRARALQRLAGDSGAR